MQMSTILTLVIAFLEALPKMAAAGIDLYLTARNFAAKLRELREQDRDPTAEEWTALNAMIEIDEARLNKEPLTVTQPTGVTTPGLTSGED